MLFNKDSKIVRISASAEGYYSGAIAYGELYLPYNFFENNEEKLRGLRISVCELDGKHSEVPCEIEFEEFMILDVLNTENGYSDVDKDIDEKVFFRVCDLLDLSEKQSDIINNFHNELKKLDKFIDTTDYEITLSKDTSIEGVLIPKGTIISYSIEINNETDDWSWEFECENLF